VDNDPPVALSVAPHPDDELLGAGALLMGLRDAGWRIVNLACSLGRPPERERRRRELAEACRRAGFELVIPDGLPPIGAKDDLTQAESALSRAIGRAVTEHHPRVIVGPSPHDFHHGHEVVGRAIRHAVEAGQVRLRVLFWGLWADLPFPTVTVWFDRVRLREIQRALEAHAGELARNRFDRLLAGRAAANAVLGPERVFGYGVRGSVDAGAPAGIADEDLYAELFTEVDFVPPAGWRLAPPRVFRASADAVGFLDSGGEWLEGCEGSDFGWWLRAPSISDLRSCSGS
jgi:LmbE family N-acetylglucosaminyl deacetylase